MTQTPAANTQATPKVAPGAAADPQGAAAPSPFTFDTAPKGTPVIALYAIHAYQRRDSPVVPCGARGTFADARPDHLRLRLVQFEGRPGLTQVSDTCVSVLRSAPAPSAPAPARRPFQFPEGAREILYPALAVLTAWRELGPRNAFFLLLVITLWSDPYTPSAAGWGRLVGLAGLLAAWAWEGL